MQGTKVVKGAVLLVAALAAVSGTAAFANIGVSSSALNGVANAVRADGSLKPNAVGHMQLKNGIVACEKFTQDPAERAVPRRAGEGCRQRQGR